MKHAIHTVADAGRLIRAMRAHAGVRIDDFAAMAGVSKQFMTDVENGKPTVRMGKVLALLAEFGLVLSADVPDGVPLPERPPAEAADPARQRGQRRGHQLGGKRDRASDTKPERRPPTS